MLVSNCAICGKKKSRFIKNQFSNQNYIEVMFHCSVISYFKDKNM